jgi:hypothetical protein
MNVLIFTQEEYNKVIAIQSGQHRTASVALTNVTYFVMEDVLTEILEGIYKDKLKGINYTVQSFESIQDLLPVSEEEIINRRGDLAGALSPPPSSTVPLPTFTIHHSQFTIYNHLKQTLSRMKHIVEREKREDK